MIYLKLNLIVTRTSNPTSIRIGNTPVTYCFTDEELANLRDGDSEIHVTLCCDGLPDLGRTTDDLSDPEDWEELSAVWGKIDLINELSVSQQREIVAKLIPFIPVEG